MPTSIQQSEAESANAITYTAVVPRFAPETGVGQSAIRAYAARNGESVEDFLQSHRETSGPPVTAEIAGTALLQLVRQEPVAVAPGYVLTGAGLRPLP
ncbi:MAG: hypothetical protein ACJ8R9_03845 [Steroidobacteraceae bacterium]